MARGTGLPVAGCGPVGGARDDGGAALVDHCCCRDVVGSAKRGVEEYGRVRVQLSTAYVCVLQELGLTHQVRLGDVAAFEAAYGAKFPKAVAKITDDVEELLAFYDYPAEHWIHLRTTNPIESTFATVRHRTKVTRGPGSRAAGLAMAFKLIEAAQARWRAVNAPHLVALVRAGATFVNGKLVERPDDHTQPEAA
jgi:Transposase, Mutator family